MKDFDVWISNFRESIASYSYYTDFEKIYKNVDAVKVELNILNSLIGSHDIEKDFIELVKKYPEILKCVPILIAKRATEVLVTDDEGVFFRYNFGYANYSIDQYAVFLRETGIFDLIENHIVSNLIDYVTGVETGLDSNARKNRGGDAMEDLVEKYIIRSGRIRDKDYFKEMYVHEIEQRWHIDLSSISNNGTTEKRFDFVIKGLNTIYGIETNFYTGGGSKLNETARSYKTLTLETNGLNNFKFVWITDGKGWVSARYNLKETFDILEHIYNLSELEKGALNHLI